MWVEEKCNNTCKFCLIDVPCSEMCDAVIGDYCQAADTYILPHISEWETYDEETKAFYSEMFLKLGIDIPYTV
jgi:hypothetical protein